MKFDGQTIEPQDVPRLWTQLMAIEDMMVRRGDWLTFSDIRHLLYKDYAVESSEASISARLRDLRKPRFGAYVVERRRQGPVWQYRVLPPLPTGQLEML
jgi:hypothetical protein